MDVMWLAHRALATDAAERRRRLSGLSLPDFLVFAGLEGCRRLANDRQDDLETREVWTAVGNLIAWKLATADARSLDPTAAQNRRSASIEPSRLVDAGSPQRPGTSPLARRATDWIVDTSLHHDHERFGGFLKVALEELVIALRDDSRLLRAVDGAFLLERARQMRSSSDADAAAVRPGLYPSGFSLPAFVEVVESGRIWDGARSSEASDETPKPVG